MLKALLRKQLLEIYRSFFYDYKKNKVRSRANMIAFIIFYVVLMVGILGGSFSALAYGLASAFVPAGLGWLYFDIMLLIAIVLGIFGTVFNTYSSLYLATDNDLLLSMPIPPRSILLARLLGVYMMDLLFSGVVLIPTVIMYYIFAPVSFATIAGPIIMVVLVTVFVMVLSVALGWVIAKASTKFKNKSFISVLVALLGIGVYYVVYFKAFNAIEAMMMNMQDISIEITGFTKVFYFIGSAGEGKLIPVIGMTAVIAALTAVVLTVLSRSFIKIVTTKTGNAKIEYREKTAKANSVRAAILKKELARFTSSSTYMLNCGLGSVLMVLAAAMLVIKGKVFSEALLSTFGGMNGVLSVMLAGAMVFIMSMNDSTACSVSLEGKDIWIYQSMPIATSDVLWGKFMVHIVITLVPGLLLAFALCVTFGITALQTVLVLLFTAIACVFGGAFGLMINLKKPNQNWTSEAMVVKQSFGVMIAMFGGWLFGMVVIVSGILLAKTISATLILVLWSIVTIILDVLLFCWLKTKGCRIFQSL
ncbi:MAG: hypothetical protein MJ057_04735 [Sphaerochaetaceae bacterium]|nr:hypothetical protein [Sphaerochaetaceae bacterium]